MPEGAPHRREDSKLEGVLSSLNNYHTAVPLEQVLHQDQNSLQTLVECPWGHDGSLELPRLMYTYILVYILSVYI